MNIFKLISCLAVITPNCDVLIFLSPVLKFYDNLYTI